MAENYLPSTGGISIFGGEIYAKRSGETHPAGMGHCSLAEWTPEVEEIEVYASTTGTRTKIDTVYTETGATFNVTLQEATARNMAMALMGTQTELTQTASTSNTLTVNDVVPGHLVDLGALDVSNVTAVDGSAGSLTAGTDFIVDEASGTVKILTAQTQIDFTFDQAEIAAADARTTIEILSEVAGVVAEFTIIGKNSKGKRYKLEGVKGNIRPSGSVQFISDGSDVQTIELEVDVIYNDALPATPYGVVTPLN